MAQINQKQIEARKKFVEAWNKTMIDIWQERIFDLKVIDSKELYRSVVAVETGYDDRVVDVTLEESFLEYGIWQDLGVGRELKHGQYERNKKYIEDYGRPREPRRWFSVKYFSSVLRLRDFMAESIGDEFKSMFCAALDSDKLKKQTDFYKRKGY